MLKHILLGGVNYLPLFAPDKEGDGKSDAEKQREEIEVTTSKETEQPDNDDNQDDDDVNDDKEEKEIEAKDDAIEKQDDKVDELEEELKDKSLTAKDRERLEKRVEKERKKARDLREENDRLKKELEAKSNGETLTEEDVERRSDEKLALKEFERAQARIAKAGEKLDKKFVSLVEEMAEESGKIPGQMIGILDDLPNNGGDVLLYLAKNPDEYEEIRELSPAKMAIKLDRISQKLTSKPKKEISKVPDPKEPVGGKGSTPEQRASEKDDMDTWVNKRNREAENHRRKKAGLPPLSAH